MEPVGYHTTADNITESYLGDYIDLITEELTNVQPDVPILVESFRRILQRLTTMLQRETTVRHGGYECECDTYIRDKLPKLIALEEELQAVIQQDIITDTKECWLSQMHSKYNLLFHMTARGQQLVCPPRVRRRVLRPRREEKRLQRQFSIE